MMQPKRQSAQSARQTMHPPHPVALMGQLRQATLFRPVVFRLTVGRKLELGGAVVDS